MQGSVPDIQILAYEAGDLAGDAAGLVGAAIAADTTSSAILDLVRMVRLSLVDDDSTPAPAAAISRAKAIFGVPSPDRAPSALEQIVTTLATLVYDSRVHKASVRDASSDSLIQMSFEADDVEIALEGQPVPGEIGRWHIIGQVSPDEGPRECQLAFRPAGRVPIGVNTDDRGMFTVTLAAGSYDVWAMVNGRVISTPEVELG